MIRKAVVCDRIKILHYLNDEPSMNSLVIGYIENFGFDTEFFDLWTEFDEYDNIKGVLLRYDDSFIPYSKGEFDVYGFAEIIKSCRGFERFSGKNVVTEKFESILGLSIGTKVIKHLCELKDGKHLKETDSCVKIVTVQDIDRLIDLKNVIPEFGTVGSFYKSMKRELATKSGRTYYVEKDGIIVACANTTVENSISTMIVRVSTRPDYRGRGYSSMCMNALCSELLYEGKTLCLYYDNPIAGRIYKRLGFKDVGLWSIYKKQNITY
jgi:uncharacterized protein